MYRLNFYVPENDLERVKAALFLIGAGKIGNYEKCCWQIKGQGQFLPLQNSNPTIGEIEKIEKLEEVKVEMVCDDDLILKVAETLKKVHPYEEPAYDFVKILTLKDID